MKKSTVEGDLVFGDKIIHLQNPINTKQYFIRCLEEHDWEHIVDFYGVGNWNCLGDNRLEIEIRDCDDSFYEPYVDFFPDKTSYKYQVNALNSGVVVHRCCFISLDGGRIFVPMPKTEILEIDESVEYYWNLNDFECKLEKVIGRYTYLRPDLETISKITGIQIRK